MGYQLEGTVRPHPTGKWNRVTSNWHPAGEVPSFTD